jgi:cytochrome P450 family 103
MNALTPTVPTPGIEPPTVTSAELEYHVHEVYRRLRQQTPVVKRQDGMYIVLRAADQQLATDPRTRQLETEHAASLGVTSGPLYDFLSHGMLLSNGQLHRRRRAPVSKAFAFKLITQLRPRIRAIAEELIDRVHAKGEMDLLRQYAALIPALVIGEILGVPAADIPTFTRESYSLARVLSSAFTREIVPELQASAQRLIDYVEGLLKERREIRRDDFLTDFLDATDEAADLTPLDCVAQIVSLLLAGSDTTRVAMAIQTSLLLQHRHQWEAVCDNPGLIPGAVSESLRYEPVAASLPRFTLEDIPMEQYLVPRHCVLSLSTISAMRDPALYADPDRFDITRTDHPRKHPVFGTGAHRCLGEVLARTELEEGLAALTTRLPHLRFSGSPPVISGSSGIRVITEARVRW